MTLNVDELRSKLANDFEFDSEYQNELDLRYHNLRILENVFPTRIAIRLEHLTIARSKIESVDRRTFSNLPQLQSLNLISNCIEFLDDQLFYFNENLRILNLSKNRLRLVTFDLFCSLRNLIELNLSANQLKDFSHIYLPNLKLLSLKENEIKCFEANVMPSLTELVLSQNYLHTLTNLMFNDMRKLSNLELCDNYLKKIEPQAFFALSELNVLCLASNRLQKLPKMLLAFNLQLRHLDLAENNLQTLDKDIFFNLHELQTIDLSVNKLESLDAQQFVNNDRLQSLNLNDNRIRHFDSKCFRTLVNLKRFTCTNNLYGLHFEHDLFAANVNLEHLKLKNSRIFKIDNGTFSHLRQLSELDLQKNCLEYLPDDFLPNDYDLESVNLSMNRLKFISSVNFPAGRLRRLFLASNEHLRIDSQTFSKIIDIEELNLNNTKFTGRFSRGENGFEHLKIDHLTTLITLNLSGNETLEYPLKYFEKLINLRNLYLNSNSFSDFCAESKSITMREHFRHETLARRAQINHIRSITHRIVRDPFFSTSNNQLELLSISDCKIRQIESTVFVNLRQLVYLNLADNELSDLNESVFSDLIKLQFLYLNRNRLSRLAADLFRCNSNLIYLNLSGNRLAKLKSYCFGFLVNLRFLAIDRGCRYPSNFLESNQTYVQFV